MIFIRLLTWEFQAGVEGIEFGSHPAQKHTPGSCQALEPGICNALTTTLQFEVCISVINIIHCVTHIHYAPTATRNAVWCHLFP